MKQITRLALAMLALVFASPSFASNDVVTINGLPLFVSTVGSGAVIPVAVYNSTSAPLSVAGAPNSSVPISISTATTTQLVALSGSTKIYVTAWDVIAAGTGNIQLEYGTGTNCGTGTTALTGSYNLTAQAGIAKGNGLAAVLVVPAGNALCALTSAAVGMYGSVSYTQF